ncbi:hypothetical protein [uncultured Anaerovibrio sp.]|uniref:hypothetical protein n=1 Tax=uncultured Anaerovibrio sp. TaxID=361586 RepID=UPI0025F531E8|nr:hypothetical protein [uncultured Anaerovibrio sp.]
MCKVKIIDILIFLLVLKNLLSLTRIIVSPDLYGSLLTIFIIVIFVIDSIGQKYTPRRLLGYFGFGVLCLYSWYLSKDGLIANTMITCMIIHRFDMREITQNLFRWNFRFLLVHTILAVLLALVGVIELGSYHSLTRYRFDFGFTHANVLGMYIVNLIVLYTWNTWENLTYKKIGWLFFFSVITFVFTDSRTAFIALLVFIFIIVICMYKNCFKKIVRKMAMFATPVFAALTIFLCDLYANGNIISIVANVILNNRIMLGSYMLTHFSPSLLGQDVNMEVMWEQLYNIADMRFDCAYTYLYISGGFIWLAVIILTFYLISRVSDARVHASIITFAIYAVTEVNVLNGIKFFPILILTVIFGKINYESLFKEKKALSRKFLPSHE